MEQKYLIYQTFLSWLEALLLIMILNFRQILTKKQKKTNDLHDVSFISNSYFLLSIGVVQL